MQLARFSLLLLWINFSSAFAFGGPPRAQVVEVSAPDRVLVTQRDPFWRIGDKLCVLRDWEEVACGVVVYSAKEKAEVQLTEQNDSIAKGDWVQAAADQNSEPKDSEKPHENVPATNSKLASGFKAVTHEKFQISIDPFAGPGFIAAAVHAERAVSKKVTVGLKIAAVDTTFGGMTGKGPGFLACVNWYGRQAFEGAWLQLTGGELFLAQSSGVNSWHAFYASLGAGLRVRRQRHSFGLQIGPRYLQRPPNGTSDSSSFKPMVNFEFGLIF